MKPVTREVMVERRQHTVRWSAIIGGVLVAVGAWMALQMIGLGAGLTAIDLDDASQSRGAGIGAGIWTVVVPLIAMFIGGFVASRLARLFDREHAALHGAVLWAITTLAGVFLLTWTITSLMGTVARSGRVVVSTASSLAVPQDTQEVRAVLRDIGGRAARGEDVDHDTIVASIDRHTDLSRADADDLAAQIEARLDSANASARDVAQAATDTAGKTLLGAGIALILSLLTSIAGAVIGARRKEPVQRHTETPTTPIPPIAPPF